MKMSKEEIRKVADIVLKNLSSRNSMQVILQKGINEYISINVGFVSLDIVKFIENTFSSK